MFRSFLFLVATFLFFLSSATSAAIAQVDAQQAFSEGKAAFEAGQFQQARDLLIRASQTDVENAEVLLLLGKAHYQLGEVAKAANAWETTLRLAPDEPYAKRMLSVLRGTQAGAGEKMQLVESHLKDRLWAEAEKAARQIAKEPTLNDTQRARLLAVRATALLELQKPNPALLVVQTLRSRNAPYAERLDVQLLQGRIQLARGGQAAHAGAALLKKLTEANAETPEGAAAALRLLEFDLLDVPDATKIGQLETWLKEHADHHLAKHAQQHLINALLSLSQMAPPPRPDAGLSPMDAKAIAVATVLYNSMTRETEALQLTNRILTHLNLHYAKHGAHAAAQSGIERLLKAPLPPTSRWSALQTLVFEKTEVTLARLQKLANGGTLPDGPLPDNVKQIVDQIAQMHREFPARSTWHLQGNLAQRLRGLSRVVPWPAKTTELKAPQRWAVEVAVPVIQNRTDQGAAEQALKLLTGLIDELGKLSNPKAIDLSLSVSNSLVEVVVEDRPQWKAVLLQNASLLDRMARRDFSENVKAGRDSDNGKPSTAQEKLIQTLRRVARQQKAAAAELLALLDNHLKPWLAREHIAVAESAYAGLAVDLPLATQLHVRLRLAQLATESAFRRHLRLESTGQEIPQQLDATLAQTLGDLRTLQGAAGDNHTLRDQARAAWLVIVHHYESREYFDVAQEAIQLAPQEDSQEAAEYSQLQYAHLLLALAKQDLDHRLANYGEQKVLQRTEAIDGAIKAYETFLVDHPQSELTTQAVDRFFQIAQLFERHHAYAVAAEIYRSFAAQAAGLPILSRAAPGHASVAQRAALAAVAALDADARNELAEQMKNREAGAETPGALSEKFSAAIAGYKQLIAADASGPLVAQATQKVMAIALEHAKMDAWDVAARVYQQLLDSELQLLRPERLELASAICLIGKAMPDHAREVLSALSLQTSSPASEEKADAQMLARIERFTSGLYETDRAKETQLGLKPGSTTGGSRPEPTRGVASTQAAPAAGQPADDLSEIRLDALFSDAGGLAQVDSKIMASIRRQQQQRANQIAMLEGARFANGDAIRYVEMMGQDGGRTGEMAVAHQIAGAVKPALSEAEITRQSDALTAAQKSLQAIRDKYAHTITAAQCRAEILLITQHWRGLAQWARAAKVAEQYLAANPRDSQLPQLRLRVGQDYLAWAADDIESKPSKQDMLAEVAGRFDKAREVLSQIITDFPQATSVQHNARWNIAVSYMTQARSVAGFSATMARGQYARAARELNTVAQAHADHPRVGQVPQMLWDITQELVGRRYFEEAIDVWNDLMIFYPSHALAAQAALQIAETYHNQLKRPLLAAEAYQELNFARGGSQTNLQDAIFQIGAGLKNEKRWVEALHVLESFVDGFPSHALAGEAMTMVGQIHQANQAWEDAIDAYQRVINDFPSGSWVRDAKWSTSDCKINLSRWSDAVAAYEDYQRSYPNDDRINDATARIGTLRDLARYQTLVDENDHSKAFDVQFEIARVVRTQLANRVKSIIEFRKVQENWPQSHLADDALYEVGVTYLALGETAAARGALRGVADEYPNSPLADDALFMIGKSYEDEAAAMAAVTRDSSRQQAQTASQFEAYTRARDNRGRNLKGRASKVAQLKKAGKDEEAELAGAALVINEQAFEKANTLSVANWARQAAEVMSAAALADRQDKINAALRRAVKGYSEAAQVAAADKADEALLRMASIYDLQLKDPEAAMNTWLEIVRQFSGTTVAEDASWKIAENYARQNNHEKAVQAYKAFLRNYRSSARASAAQLAIAGIYEKMGQWVNAMDAYTNYLNNFPEGPLLTRARTQIAWIKTYRL